MLGIFTSFWVLCPPKAGRNILLWRFSIFYYLFCSFKLFQPAFGCAQHPKNGQNTQQYNLVNLSPDSFSLYTHRAENWTNFILDFWINLLNWNLWCFIHSFKRFESCLLHERENCFFLHRKPIECRPIGFCITKRLQRPKGLFLKATAENRFFSRHK